MTKAALWLTLSISLAGVAGFGASVALSQGPSQPQKTVTISVHNGATGPAGPRGPTGAAGVGGGPEACPAGSKFGKLVINHPGGQVAILTCIVD